MITLKTFIQSPKGILALIVGFVLIFVVAAQVAKQNAIETISNALRSNSFTAMETKAVANNISVDEQINRDAKWILENSDNWGGKWWNW